MIGIIASMDDELEFLKAALKEKKEEEFLFNSSAVTGTYEGKEYVLCKCFTGKVNMASIAQALIERYPVEIVINIGVCASSDESFLIKDVFVFEECVEYDMDDTALGYELGEIPDINKKFFTADEAFLAAAESAKNQKAYRVHFGRGMTGDVFVTDKNFKENIIKNFGKGAIDMETGALAHTAYLNSIPWAAVRGISDGGNEESSEAFRANLSIASENAAKFLLETMKYYK